MYRQLFLSFFLRSFFLSLFTRARHISYPKQKKGLGVLNFVKGISHPSPYARCSIL